MFHNLTLLTDLYQLTMANGYWQNGQYNHEAVFHLFFRKHPFKGNYTVAAGLEQAIDYLRNLKFDVEDIQYLASLKDAEGDALFDESFLNYLQRFQFSCDVDAVPEGTVVFPHTPLIRLKGPLIQVQLVETALLNIINFSSLIATKASRIVQAAQGDRVIEFGLRRAQGPDGAISASRAAYIGGCHATSNVLAGRLYGIPIRGTHAHSWVMSHDSEIDAFRQYAKAMPGNCVFLVDTFDTEEGVRKAIEVGLELRKQGYDLRGIRLDSGDLSELSKKARIILDDAGFPEAKIVASNDLDEYRIKELKDSGAKITVWGVGTRLSTAFDQPALGGVYKLAAIRESKDSAWKYKVKLSEQSIKVSNPGILDTYRFKIKDKAVADMIVNTADEISSAMITFGDEDLKPDGKAEPLLQAIFRNGEYVYQLPDIESIRAYCMKEVNQFSGIHNYPVGLESNLHELKGELIQNAKA